MDGLMDKQQESNKVGDEEELIRRGAWTIEEDITLINYIAHHGEGQWNSLASCAGLKRTGKSCRLRWLNYLRPDVSRGNITLQEQLLILQLHSQWGNKWSKIAQHLPGRTDNEIKNYWRTRVQKHAKQLNCDVDSTQFKDIVRHLWIPRLVEKIQAADGGTAPPTSVASSSVTATYQQNSGTSFDSYAEQNNVVMSCGEGFQSYTPENSRAAGRCESLGTTVNNYNNNQDYYPCGGDFEQNSMEQWLVDGGDTSESLWFLQQQFNTD